MLAATTSALLSYLPEMVLLIASLVLNLLTSSTVVQALILSMVLAVQIFSQAVAVQMFSQAVLVQISSFTRLLVKAVIVLLTLLSGLTNSNLPRANSGI